MISDGAKYSKVNTESPVGFRGVDVEGVTLGDSPNAETMLRGMPDFSASTGSLGSGKSTDNSLLVLLSSWNYGDMYAKY